jgi:DNA-binding response OmpR family regulator
MLVSYGHEVEVTNSARAALDIFEPGRFDLVVIDYLMPEMKGDELAASIKVRSASQAILIITAAMEALESSGKPVDVDSVIAKPFQIEELRNAVDAVLAKHSP